MPWQDIQARMEGPSVLDVVCNFALRWNTLAKKNPKKWDYYILPTLEEYEEPIIVGNDQVQVLRSAGSAMCVAEDAGKAKGIITGAKIDNIDKNAKYQDEIYQAMMKLIKNSKDYIYIESQYFLSDYGETSDVADSLSVPANAAKSTVGFKEGVSGLASWWNSDIHDNKGIHNKIVDALSERIHRHILSEFSNAPTKGFHLYLVLPVYPEGNLADGSLMNTIFHTMQTLVGGEKSLLKRIRYSIRVKEVLEEARAEGAELNVKAVEESVKKDLKGLLFTEDDYQKCKKYITVLNLRNWRKIEGNAVTEQIYIHSKIMIVDDLFAIIGSANVNDRSLLGTRDSELALLVVGEPDGEGHRRFARDFREQLWRKMLGVAKNSEPGRGITEAEFQELFEMPMTYQTGNKIQKIAETNSKIYERIFRHVPRNYYKKIAGDVGYVKDNPNIVQFYSSIYPTLDPTDKKKSINKFSLPFYEEFWLDGDNENNSGKYKISGQELEKIRGYIISMPVFWSYGESNDLKYSLDVITQNDNKENSMDMGEGKIETIIVNNNINHPEEDAFS
ncbi:phospholipase D-like domain-containing protein [Limnobaculum zhutongyuii]